MPCLVLIIPSTSFKLDINCAQDQALSQIKAIFVKCQIHPYWLQSYLTMSLPISNQHNLELLQAEGQLNQQIQAALKRFREKLQESGNIEKKQSGGKLNEQKEGPQKRFIFRQSLMSMMFQIRDFQTIYNMVVASFIILTFSLFYDSYVSKGQVLDMIAFFGFFRGGHVICAAWMLLTLVFYCIIFVTKFALKTNKYIWIPLYCLHITANVSIATHFASYKELGFASAIIIMAQSVRMLMKAHSYFRTKLLYLKENPYRHFSFRGITVVNSKLRQQQEEENNHKFLNIDIKDEDIFSEIKKLSYFFVAPTLIYRDSYVLTPLRSTRKIIVHLINFLACIYYSFILYQNWCKQVIEELEQRMDMSALCSAIINLMLPSVLFLVFGFFGFLHSWLNLWSQITRFPDRVFYSDWWNSLEFGSYYRKWNIVVHDWLYYYVYLDFYRFFPSLQKQKVLAQLLTFLISAVIHEVIIYYAIGFFYPILFILFAGPGILFMQLATLRRSSVNLIFWLQMYIGMAIMMTLYLVECFARQKISDEVIYASWGSLSPIIPRTLYLGQMPFT